MSKEDSVMKRLYLPIAGRGRGGVTLVPAHAQRWTSPEQMPRPPLPVRRSASITTRLRCTSARFWAGLCRSMRCGAPARTTPPRSPPRRICDFGDLKVPKGRYSIWTIPTGHDWTLILNKQTGQSHLYYDESRDFGRTKMNVKMLLDRWRPSASSCVPGRATKGTLALIWEQTEASIPFTVGK